MILFDKDFFMAKLNLTTASLPQYTMTLPISKMSCKFRPFVVREEKVLLLALQSKDITNINDAMRNIILACTNSTLDTKKMCSADSEYAFLQIRAKSVGEEVKPQIVCSNCNTSTSVKIRLDQISVSEVEKPIVDSTIKITDDLSLVMRYPTIHDIDPKKNELEMAFELARMCVESIIMGDQVHEVKDINPRELSDFIDNLLPNQFKIMIEYIQSSPQLAYKFEYPCPKCKKTVNTEIRDMADFFQ